MKEIRIEGTITIDNITSQFYIGIDADDCSWSQWGAVQERLSESVPVLDAMEAGLQQAYLDGELEIERDDE